MAFDTTNFLETAIQANNGDFTFTDRSGNTSDTVKAANQAGEWSEENGSTTSGGTGPASNPPSRAGFIYTETSTPAASTTWAMQWTTAYDNNSQNVFLDLIYNLNAEIASDVLIEYATIASPNETTDWTILETIPCTLTDSWISDTFDFSAVGSTTTLRVRVRCDTDNNFTNDIAFSTWRIYGIDSAGIGSVTPSEFDHNNTNIDIDGSSFEASQGTGTVWISDANTLAGSANEVEIANAITSWSDTQINLNLTDLNATELGEMETLGPGARFLIVMTNGSVEFGSPALTTHRAKAFALKDSTNILASGEITTFQLTAPGIKTTGDFGGGRIQDDENPADTVDLGLDEYGEWEWAMEAVAPSDGEYLGAQSAETYQFRVVFETETLLDTYTVTPEWTISSGGKYTQSAFRAKNDTGGETSTDWIAAINIDWTQDLDSNFRIRFLIEETDDVEDLDIVFQLQYNLSSGGWNNVTASSSVVRSSASGFVTDGIDTTEQLSGPGTFLTTNAGFDEVDGAAGGANLDFTTTINQEVEVEYCVQLRSADTIGTDTVQLRIVKGTSTQLTVYTNTPTITPNYPAYTQSSFRARNDDGSESGATWKEAINTNWNQSMNINARIRFLIEETVDLADANVAFQLQYNHESAGWFDVTAVSSVIRSFSSDETSWVLTDGDNTTEQLSGPGTFLTTNSGYDDVNGIAGGANLDFTSTPNEEVELEFCFQVRSAEVTVFETVQLRLLVDAGTGGITVYTIIPTLTAVPPPHWIMSSSSNFADGDPTTDGSQMSNPPGSTFVAGEIKETDGVPTQQTLEGSEYTEHEFCMQATSDSTTSAQYEFRVTDAEDLQAGEKLEEQDVDPKVTLI